MTRDVGPDAPPTVGARVLDAAHLDGGADAESAWRTSTELPTPSTATIGAVPCVGAPVSFRRYTWSRILTMAPGWTFDGRASTVGDEVQRSLSSVAVPR